jgi:hypothetical protein
MDAYETVGT